MNTDLADPKNGQHVWDKGPDALIDSDLFIASKLDQAVKLRVKDADYKKYPPISIYSMFENTVKINPNHPALVYKKTDSWVHLTYDGYWKMCVKAAKSFIKVIIA